MHVEGIGDVDAQERVISYLTKHFGTELLRRWLKQQGWKRRDRASGPNQSDELWRPPWDDIGYEPGLVSLRAALRKQLRSAGFRTDQL